MAFQTPDWAAQQLELKQHFLFQHFPFCQDQILYELLEPRGETFLRISSIRYVSRLGSIPLLVNNEVKNKNHQRWRKPPNGHLMLYMLVIIRRSEEIVLMLVCIIISTGHWTELTSFSTTFGSGNILAGNDNIVFSVSGNSLHIYKSSNNSPEKYLLRLNRICYEIWYCHYWLGANTGYFEKEFFYLAALLLIV